MPKFIDQRWPHDWGGLGRHPLTRMGVVLAAVVVAAAAGSLTPAGTAATAWVGARLEYYAGVFSLVALSLTVMGGVAATARAVFSVRYRAQLQIAHRAMAFLAMAFLAVHIVMKVITAHVGALDAVLPFVANHRTLSVGLGTVAAYFMVIPLWTGVARARFAGTTRPWLWRALHGSAYVAWPVALAHGLEAGRSAKPWVVLSYVVCLIVVGVALVVRLFGWLAHRTGTARARTAGPIHAGVVGGPVVATVSVVPAEPVTPAATAPTLPAPSGSSTMPKIHNGQVERTPRIQSRKPRSPRPSDRPVHRSPSVHASPGGSDGRHAADGQATVKPQPAESSRRVLPPDASDDQFWAFMRGEAVR